MGAWIRGGHDAVLYGNRLISALNLKKREFFSDEYAWKRFINYRWLYKWKII